MTRLFCAAVLIGLTACHGPDALDAWPMSLATRSLTSQPGLAGYAVNDPPSVQLLDADGKGISGAKITFTATTSAGSATAGVVTTGSDGVASLGGWTLAAGPNTVRASIPAPFRVAPATFAATGLAPAYHIDVNYLTPITPARRAVFDSAAARWQRMIYGDIPDIPIVLPDSICLDQQPPIDQNIDDVLILVVVDSIDGPGTILGGGGPCVIRSASKLPLIGVMIFDSADVDGLMQQGVFDEVIMHEMGHVLGFGTIWYGFFGVSPPLLVGPAAQGGADPHFVGTKAVAAFNRIGGTRYTGGLKVPVEALFGPGTEDSHWRESVFGNELMTGFINLGAANPVSIVTVAAQGDEGYLVNYAAADPYTHSFSAAAKGAPEAPGAARIALGDDVLRLPIFEVDRRGRVTRVHRR